MNSYWDSTVKSYNYVVDELSHPRSKDMLFLMSPFSLLAILLTYNIFCVKIGPMMMKNKSPFKLIMILKLYNICQVIGNMYMFNEGCWYLFQGNFNFKCEGVDDTPDLDGRVVSGVQVYFITKIVDLLDTVFYVLRKSDRQISSLHLYHHNLMVLAGWIGLKYLPGGQSILIGIINALVHVFMYTYYFLSGMGPAYQKFLWWKKYLTVMQIVQFLIILIHSFNSLFYHCSYPSIVKVLTIIEAVIFVFLFSKFYYLNYIKKPAEKRNKSINESCENDGVGNSRMDSNRESIGNNYSYDKSGERIKSKQL